MTGGFARPANAAPADSETRFVQLINDLRASKGLAPLHVNVELRDIARGWAGHLGAQPDCAGANALQHNPNFVPPSGQMSAELAKTWRVVLENVGCVGPADDQTLHDGFVASPHHLANMLDPRVDSIGVGAVVGPGNVLWIAEDFGAYDPVTAPASAPANGRAVVAAPAAGPAALALTTPATAPKTKKPRTRRTRRA